MGPGTARGCTAVFRRGSHTRPVRRTGRFPRRSCGNASSPWPVRLGLVVELVVDGHRGSEPAMAEAVGDKLLECAAFEPEESRRGARGDRRVARCTGQEREFSDVAARSDGPDEGVVPRDVELAAADRVKRLAGISLADDGVARAHVLPAATRPQCLETCAVEVREWLELTELGELLDSRH